MFSVMPAMYLLLLQSNENSSLKLIAWLIKLNTVAKNSIILSAAHDYFEFSQTTEWCEKALQPGYQEGRIHTFADILLRYTRYAFVISAQEIPEIWSHRPVLGSHTPEERKELRKMLFSDKISQKYLSTEISMQFIAFSLSEETHLEFSRKRNSRRLWMLAECFTNDRDLDATEERREECTMEICDKDTEAGHQWVITWGLGHWQEVSGNIQKRSRGVGKYKENSCRGQSARLDCWCYVDNYFVSNVGWKLIAGLQQSQVFWVWGTLNGYSIADILLSKLSTMSSMQISINLSGTGLAISRTVH